MEWTEDNFLAECDDTPFTFFDQIDNEFRLDFRLPLEKILKNDIDAFFDFLEDKIKRDCNERKEDKALKKFREFQEELPEPEEPIIKEDTGILPPTSSILTKIGGFIRGFFK